MLVLLSVKIGLYLGPRANVVVALRVEIALHDIFLVVPIVCACPAAWGVRNLHQTAAVEEEDRGRFRAKKHTWNASNAAFAGAHGGAACHVVEEGGKRGKSRRRCRKHSPWRITRRVSGGLEQTLARVRLHTTKSTKQVTMVPLKLLSDARKGAKWRGGPLPR